ALRRLVLRACVNSHFPTVPAPVSPARAYVGQRLDLSPLQRPPAEASLNRSAKNRRFSKASPVDLANRDCWRFASRENAARFPPGIPARSQCLPRRRRLRPFLPGSVLAYANLPLGFAAAYRTPESRPIVGQIVPRRLQPFALQSRKRDSP